MKIITKKHYALIHISKIKFLYHLPPSVMGSLNVPVPLALTAATWKAYLVFGVRPIMMSSIVLTDLYRCTSLSAPQVA